MTPQLNEDLTRPIRLGSQRAINRIVMAPMTNKQSHEDGTLSAAEVDWLGMRADGGFGVVITGAWAVAPEGRAWEGQAGLYAERHLAPLVGLAQRIASTDALGIVQVHHGGSRSAPEITHTRGISSSDGPDWDGASDDDIQRIIEAHRAAADRVRAAGLHGIEIHAAHGFLPAQFISRTDNRRTDRWGGDLDGRARFVREVVRAIRTAAGNDFVIGVRLSPENHHHGIVLEETAQIAAWLADDGMDYLHLSLGHALASSSHEEGRRALEVVRALLPRGLPIVAAGSIRTPHDATRVRRLGADLVALGTAAIHDPSWPQHATDPGRLPDVSPSTPEHLAAAGVTPPFLQYLREGWPDSIIETPTDLTPGPEPVTKT
ncbi:NADH:flavin oxidoreductase [Amnibacterium sp.]|uniref:NADH:flavin oxidoreductase n=1 Tax=Amnibacterium sp. TaxID=1872496 RepID=UPI00261083F3|nr:NADH:flavin oxidoreductase [Amnibacterium sp.]MCU1473034.1 2,4-dienoyl-CoA reductase [Amnibacterium sp.]